MAAETAEKATTRFRATVAARRTVNVDGKLHGPGAEIQLPKAEVERLRKLGYLVDPKAAELAAPEGASVSTEPPTV